MSYIQKSVHTIFRKIEKITISPQVWIISVFGIIAFRGFLENLSNTTKGFFSISKFSSFFLHYPLFYIVGLLSLILLFYFLSDRPNKNIAQISKVFCFGLILCWIAPISDLILTGGKGDLIKYLVFNPNNPFGSLFFIFNKPYGVSNGTRLEIIIMLIASSLYFYYKNKKITRTITYLFLSYLIILLLGVIPSIIIMFSNLQKTGILSPVLSHNQLSNFTDITTFKKIISELPQSSNTLSKNALGTYFLDILCSWIFIIVASTALNIWFYIFNKKKFVSLWKNARWERIIYYLSWVIVGFLLASQLGIYHWNSSLLNIINFVILIISIVSSCLLQININDVVDKKIDAISNPNRPLVKKSFSINDLKIYNFFLILIIIFSSASLGHEIFSLLVIWNCAYFLYSSLPFRLKQFPIISSLIIGINGTITIIIGIILASGGNIYNKISNTFILTFVLIISLISTIKDIKDIKGDKADRIKTIPVIFGEKKGKIIISMCVILALILTSLLLGSSILQMISIPFGIASTYLINRKNYKEIYLFILFYIYILVLIIFNNLQNFVK